MGSKDLRLLVLIKIDGRSRNERQFHSSLPFNLELLLRPKNKDFIKKKILFILFLLILFNGFNESHMAFAAFIKINAQNHFSGCFCSSIDSEIRSIGRNQHIEWRLGPVPLLQPAWKTHNAGKWNFLVDKSLPFSDSILLTNGGSWTRATRKLPGTEIKVS